MKMLRKQLTSAVAGALCLTGALALSSGAQAGMNDFHGASAMHGHEYGAIFQLDAGGNKAIKKTLNNIKNLINDPRVKGHIKVELIANSGGFDVYVKNNGFKKELKYLQSRGVILAQCHNTLIEKHIDRKDLYSFISVVPSGVGEITLREAQGWSYIHPSTPPANTL